MSTRRRHLLPRLGDAMPNHPMPKTKIQACVLLFKRNKGGPPATPRRCDAETTPCLSYISKGI